MGHSMTHRTALSTTGKFSPQAIETLKASFIATKSVDGSVDMKQLYTEEFPPKAAS